ncbi:MAG TPA: DegT/DnrJ/EryC1/StrS family aminotransferase [Gemmataceae bacterium]|jgi:dTDP-4-amino-4,6-dideoxygalactose transaminase|nr:DegT/DnrJ/EryC1/StrS family aminotransferase [Gemmataceae bacterium]
MPRPTILEGGEPRPLIVDPSLSLLGTDERSSLLQVFDACARRGGKEADEVEQFEQRFAARHGSPQAVAVASATSGLQVALQALGVGQGDEVLVPPYTFPASCHAVLHAGARPVFVDVDRETLCLDPDLITRRLTPRTKAVMVVHIGGKPARMGPLLEAARRHGLVVVEDAAQAHGATYAGRPVGTLGDAGVFSFSPKLMTSLRGGVILTSDAQVAERCRQFRFHGLPGIRNRVRQQRQLATSVAPHFVHHVAGYSLMMTALQAAVLMPQLDKLHERFARRHANGAYLAQGLGRLSGLQPVLGCVEGKSNFYMLEVMYDPAGFAGLDRDQLVTALSWEGVPISPTAVTHTPVYDNPSLAAFCDLPCPVAEDVLPRLLVFGHPLQSLVLDGGHDDLDRILDRVALVHRHAAQLVEFFQAEGRP